MLAKAFFIAAIACFSLHVAADDFYVARYGDNHNDGRSIQAPWRDIQHAINRTEAGDTIHIRGGVYRGSLLVNKNQGGMPDRYKTLQPYNSEAVHIKGSMRVSGWIMGNSGVYRKEGWDVNSQQVFANGTPLQQIGWPAENFQDRAHGAPSGPEHKYWPVGSGVDDLVNDSFTRGAFYYDRTNRVLYVRLRGGEDPNTKMMEASYWLRPMHSSAPYVRLRGLKFMHSNTLVNSSGLSGVLIAGSHSIMENCSVSRMDFGGVAIAPSADSVVIRNSLITQNGNNGISANYGSNFLIEGNVITANNYRDFNSGWHAGGIKSTGVSNGRIINNDISYNRGDGVWWDVGGGDWGDKAVTISGNRLRFNNYGTKPDGAPHGNAVIHYEISKNGRIFNNTVDGGRKGILLAASSDSIVSNNIIRNVDEVGLEVGGLPRTGYQASRNILYGNRVEKTSGSQDSDYLELRAVVRLDGADNYIDYNTYSRRNKQPVFKQQGENRTGHPTLQVMGLPAWKQMNSGIYDTNSVFRVSR